MLYFAEPAIIAYVSHIAQHIKEAIYGAAVYPPVVFERMAISMKVGMGDRERAIPSMIPIMATFCGSMPDSDCGPM